MSTNFIEDGECVNVKGQLYTVQYSYSGNGEPNYVQLQTDAGEFFLEHDWEGYVTQSDCEDFVAAETASEPQEDVSETVSGTEADEKPADGIQYRESGRGGMICVLPSGVQVFAPPEKAVAKVLEQVDVSEWSDSQNGNERYLTVIDGITWTLNVRSSLSSAEADGYADVIMDFGWMSPHDMYKKLKRDERLTIEEAEAY